MYGLVVGLNVMDGEALRRATEERRWVLDSGLIQASQAKPGWRRWILEPSQALLLAKTRQTAKQRVSRPRPPLTSAAFRFEYTSTTLAIDWCFNIHCGVGGDAQNQPPVQQIKQQQPTPTQHQTPNQ